MWGEKINIGSEWVSERARERERERFNSFNSESVCLYYCDYRELLQWRERERERERCARFTVFSRIQLASLLVSVLLSLPTQVYLIRFSRSTQELSEDDSSRYLQPQMPVPQLMAAQDDSTLLGFPRAVLPSLKWIHSRTEAQAGLL